MKKAKGKKLKLTLKVDSDLLKLSISKEDIDKEDKRFLSDFLLEAIEGQIGDELKKKKMIVNPDFPIVITVSLRAIPSIKSKKNRE